MILSNLIKISVFTHTVAGFIGLLFFWILIFKKKGTKSHQKIGQIFYYSLIIVCSTSILNGTVYLIADVFFEQNIKPHLGYSVVMILQGLLSMIPAYYGQLALRSINIEPSQKTIQLHLKFMLFLCFFVLVNQIYSVFLNYYLLIFYSFTAAPLAIFLCYMLLRKVKCQISSRKELLTSHIILSIFSGIALHVGFFVGGFSTKFLKRFPSNTEYAGIILGMSLACVVYVEVLR